MTLYLITLGEKHAMRQKEDEEGTAYEEQYKEEEENGQSTSIYEQLKAKHYPSSQIQGDSWARVYSDGVKCRRGRPKGSPSGNAASPL